MDVTRLSDAELADAMTIVHREVEELHGPEEWAEFLASADRLVKEAVGGFVSAHLRMVAVIGVENAHEFASQLLRRDDLKPPARRRGRVDPELDARLVAVYETAPEGEQWAAISRAMPNAKPKKVDAAMRRVERAIKARDDRRKSLENQRTVAEVIRDWPRLGGKGDKR
jgi:hypothetical protein